MKKVGQLLKKIFKNEYMIAFLIMYFFAIVIFSLEGATNYFTLPMTGDYSLQSYAFYTQGYNNFWAFIKTGYAPKFDFSNFLGANYYGTQSFYYLFSPLFYLLCLWPRKLLYQGIFFHLAFKYALGGFFFYILLRRYFHISKAISWIGGFVYAFSGWSLFYIWFHFSDVLALFPLFLIGIERLLKERKGGLLTLGFFLCGVSNYFFEVNFLIFGFFYCIYRWIYLYGKRTGHDAKTRWSVLLQGFLYFFVGILLTMVVFYPSFYVATSTTRTQSSYLTKFLSYFFVDPGYEDGSLVLSSLKSLKDIFDWENLKAFFKYCFVFEDRVNGQYTVHPYQQEGYILSGWLFMNTSCWNSTVFNTSASLDNTIGGMFITTPLAILLVPSIIRVFKEKRPWGIFGLIVGLIIPFLPITMYLAFGFTSLYGRWQIWVVVAALILITTTLDKFELVNRRFVTIGLIVNYILCGIVLYWGNKDSSMVAKDDIQKVILAEMIFMAVVWLVYRFKLFKPKVVKAIMMVFVVVEVGAEMVVTLEHKGFYNWDEYYLSQDYYPDMVQAIDDIKEEDDSFYRIFNVEATRSLVNLPSELSYNGVSTFNSTYSFYLNDFIKRSRTWYNGGWSMGYHEKRYYQDEYLGIKYYIISKTDKNNDNGDYYRDKTTYFDGRDPMNPEIQQEYDLNIPWDYKLYKSYEYYDVYKNEDYNLGIGYLVDNIISSSNAGTSRYDSGVYEQSYMDTAILLDDDYDDLLTDSNLNDISKITSKYETYSQDNWDIYFSLRDSYESDKTRKEYSISKISYDEISKIIPSHSSFLHKRWEEKEQFGDTIILKAKNYSSTSDEDEKLLCPDASESNKAYINFNFKLGPRVLITMYHNDHIVTQDAHMVCNASLSKESYEWKTQRGFYVDEPIDKITIEFVQDTSYEKFFPSSGKGTVTVKASYVYQNDVNKQLDVCKENMLSDLVYTTDTFNFKTHSDKTKVAVTNIPYDEGWTLTNKTLDEEVEILNVNGGFIGFVVDNKEVNEFELTYVTPNLKKGIVITISGLILLIVINFIYKNKKITILEEENEMAKAYYEEYGKENEVSWNIKQIFKLHKKQK